MNAEKIVSILKASGLYGWEVSDVKTEGWEFYFIRHRLDQNREKNVEHSTVKAYALSEDGEYLGSASCEISPTASEEEAEALIKSLGYRASLVKNRAYTLNTPCEAKAGSAALPDISAVSRDFIETMKFLPETESEDINSYEIFVSLKTRHFISSTGIEFTESGPESMIEVVVNARKDGHEIELYRNYSSGGCDREALRKDLIRTFAFGRDRLFAVPTPPLGRADVIFSTADACRVYEYFASRLSAGMIYRQMSSWKLCVEIAPGGSGDSLTLKAVKNLPNSSQNRSFDPEGAPVRDTVMLENGVARAYLGGRMFSSYLDLESSFIPSNFEVSGGTRPEAELRKGPYLEVVEFSDFQVDAMTGDIFGEIRLAYLHDGEKITPVSGGSVSGSMLEATGTLQASKERVLYDNWLIPAVTKLPSLTVTGAE